MTTLKTKVEALIEELEADCNRPDGRWGIHGNRAVDDDYFLALEYVINKLKKLTNG